MDEHPFAPQQQKENKGLAPRQTWLSFLQVGPPATLARALRAGVFEILFVIITLVIFFGVMNYFNILPISELYPKYLSFLPRKNVSPKQVSLQLPCPSLKEFCQKGEGVIKDGKYIGTGGKLASASAIFAVFDGVLSSTVSTFSKEKNGGTVEKQFIIAYLDNSALGLRATYFLRGRIIKTGRVSKGEQIAITNGKTISIYDNNSLVFSVIQDYPTTNNPVILTQEQFE